MRVQHTEACRILSGSGRGGKETGCGGDTETSCVGVFGGLERGLSGIICICEKWDGERRERRTDEVQKESFDKSVNFDLCFDLRN